MIIHNLRDYDSHLITKETGKLDIKVSVIPNGLEKYVAFTINRNLVLDSMQLMNSCLDSLVKSFSDNAFKYLSKYFGGEILKQVKQEGVYLHECMDSFEKFSDDKLPDRCKFFSSLKDNCINKKDYLEANNI